MHKLLLLHGYVHKEHIAIEFCAFRGLYISSQFSCSRPICNGSNGFLAGFRINGESYLHFFPNFNLKRVSINLMGSIRTNENIDNQRIILPFEISKDIYTIGIGIDTKQSLFSVYYENYTYSFKYDTNIKIQKMNVHASGSNVNTANDNISMNFGEKSFVYQVPGLIPWKDKLPMPTSKIECKIRLFLHYVIFFIL